MSIRLNQGHRKDIAYKARQLSPINEQLSDLLEKRYAIADAIRIEALGGQANADKYLAIHEEITEMLTDVPNDVRTYNTGIYVNQYMYIQLDSKRWRTSINFSEPKVVVDGTYESPQDSIPYNDYLLSLDLEEKYRKDLNDLENTVYHSISKITTVKKLLEVWAEAKELLPPELLQPKVLLPSLQSNKLNKLIGLPTKKVK